MRQIQDPVPEISSLPSQPGHQGALGDSGSSRPAGDKPALVCPEPTEGRGGQALTGSTGDTCKAPPPAASALSVQQPRGRWEDPEAGPRSRGRRRRALRLLQ